MWGQSIIRLLTLIFFISFTAVIIGNPMFPPKAIISELKFQEGNSWILEIGFEYGTAFIKNDYDSICIRTSSGYSSIELDNIQDSIIVFLVTADCLPSPLNIERSGDYITLITYRKEDDFTYFDSLSFGGYPGSMIPGLLPFDYSICQLFVFDEFWKSYQGIFTRDISPTIGFPNDTAGTTGILTGIIYDKNNTPIASDTISYEYLVNFESNGMYSTPVHSREVTRTYIYRKTVYYGGTTWMLLKTDTLNFDIYPGTEIQKDIHLNDYVSGIKQLVKPENSELEIINYPNPFNSATNFYISIPPALNNRNGEINIYDIKGEKIFTLNIEGASSVVWNGKNFYGEAVASGIYYYQFSLDNRIYKSGSMIILK